MSTVLAENQTREPAPELARPPVEAVRRRRLPGRVCIRVYRVVDEQTGEALETFTPDPAKKAGVVGALYRAARFATAQAKDEGRAVLLEGPEGLRRRYAPEYLREGQNRLYRVPCAVPGCPNWIHPVASIRRRGETVCREHFAAAPETKARVHRMNEARKRRRES